MTERITVPATLPGVVRPGTPVVLLRTITLGSFWEASPGAFGVTAWNEPDETLPRWWCAWVPCEHTESEALVPVGLSDIAVDLTDATGRAHVAWAIAAALGECQWAPLVRWEHPDGRAQAWTMQYGANVCRFWYAGTGRGPCHDLDWHDDTRLPDGSRHVDALALRAVAMHVLGGDS